MGSAFGPEEKRGIAESLSEEELAIFDLLTRQTHTQPNERNQVKQVAKALLDTLKAEDAPGSGLAQAAKDPCRRPCGHSRRAGAGICPKRMIPNCAGRDPRWFFSMCMICVWIEENKNWLSCHTLSKSELPEQCSEMIAMGIMTSRWNIINMEILLNPTLSIKISIKINLPRLHGND